VAVPFTLKAAEFSLSALQPSQHCHNFEVTTYIQPVFSIAYFLQQNLKVLVRLFNVNCMSQQDRGGPTATVDLHCLQTDLDESMKSLHCSGVCSICNSSIQSWILLQ